MIGLLIAGVVLGGLVLLGRYMVRSGGEIIVAEAARLSAARPGTATITEVHKRGIRQDTRHVVEISMRVKPASGDPYEATVSWWLDVLVMPRVQPGLDVAVKIDATDPSRVYPDNNTWTRNEARIVD